MNPTHVCDGYNVRVYDDYVCWVKRCKFEGWYWYDCNVKIPKESRFYGYEELPLRRTTHIIRENVVSFTSTIDDDANAWSLVMEVVDMLSS